jgi:hypothetical protein
MFGFAFICWLVYLAMILTRKYAGWPTNVTLLEYQRGVLYRKGTPLRDVDPGRVRVWAGVEKVIIVDTRAIPVSFENRAVTLSDGQTAVFGFSGSAEVREVRKALYSAPNYNQVPPYVMLLCSRAVLNEFSGGHIRLNQAAIEAEITKRSQLRLKEKGFELLSFRLTQLTIATPPPQPQVGLPKPTNA